MKNLKGSWSGRLVDVGGFEGTVSLSLREGRGVVDGVFDAALDGHHRPIPLRGLVAGRLKGAQLSLRLDLGEKGAPVSVTFEGDVFDTRRGEVGVCGRYVVAARRSSPLLGGVISLRQASPLGRGPDLLTRSTVATVLGAAGEPIAARAARTRARRKK